jgi:chromosome segregation ATPase
MTLEEKLSATEAKLAEAETTLTSERAAVEALRQQLASAETAKAEESAHNADLQTQLKAARKESADLAARVAELTAASKTAEAKAAEICASVGVTPLPVTAQGDAATATSTNLVEELRKQETPAAQTAFWRKNKSKIINR